MRYAWIDQQVGQYPLSSLCGVLSVSVNGYRAWKRGGKSGRTRLTDTQLLTLIWTVHAEVKGAYGSPRMTEEIRDRGFPASKERVERLMREHGIRARHKRRYRVTTDSKHKLPVARRIGRAVAQRARGFGMKIVYTDRRPAPPEIEAGARYCADLDTLLPQCDILTLHVPGGGTPLMTRREFGLLREGAVFVNAARGSLVDEDALYDALTSHRLFAAGLDVYRSEPNIDPRFAALDNVFLSPHMASATVETRDQMGFTALDNVAAVLDGKGAPNAL